MGNPKNLEDVLKSPELKRKLEEYLGSKPVKKGHLLKFLDAMERYEATGSAELATQIDSRFLNINSDEQVSLHIDLRNDAKKDLSAVSERLRHAVLEELRKDYLHRFLATL